MHHHNPECENYKYHVLRIGKTDLCNGCFANTLFMSILLPIYLIMLIESLSLVLISSIIGYSIFQIYSIYKIATVGQRSLGYTSAIFTSMYVLLCHYLLLFKPIVIDVKPVLTLVLILAFILPQFSMYFWKILTRNEFKFTKIKLMFRLLGIHGYLCALLLIRSDFVLGLAIIVVSGLMLVISREVSSWKSIADNHNNVRWRKGQAKYQLLQLKKSFSLNLRNSKELVQDTNAGCADDIASTVVAVTAVIMCPCLLWS
jgi:hypothetical protein